MIDKPWYIYMNLYLQHFNTYSVKPNHIIKDYNCISISGQDIKFSRDSITSLLATLTANYHFNT